MHPRAHAERNPTKPAIIMAGSGQCVTYAELVQRSNRCGKLFQQLGLRNGDSVALCMENDPRFLEICWAAHNTGLYYTPVNSRLTEAELAFIIDDCDAELAVLSQKIVAATRDLPTRAPRVRHWLALDEAPRPFRPYDDVVAAMSSTPRLDEVQGAPMVYSSGTTGRPKGIRPMLAGEPIDQPPAVAARISSLYGFDENTVYLSPAPLYHAAPLKFCMAVLMTGGTCIIMEKFDAEAALAALERYRVTHSQWVPTMFSRMLRLPRGVRDRFDLSAHSVAIHAAAPCPVGVKEQMLEWWGAILFEYYAGSESYGMCAISPDEWLRHRGSVGRAVRGELHILDDEGRELAPGQPGLVYFAGGSPFEYYKDPEKTVRSRNDRGWTTIGDVGYVDPEGYLYLTDRKDFVIVSGGVNIYPQEAENVLALHPRVSDVAVFGVPNEEFGEEVKAVVAPVSMHEAGPALATELIEFCRRQLASIKCPKSVDFVSELPREPTGKLMKRLLRARYWGEQAQPYALREPSESLEKPT
jgi:long-chain acyl-CoA synthetase